MYVAHNLWGFPLWAALLFGVTMCAFAGYLLELMLYRPLFKYKAGSEAVLVASLGSFIVMIVISIMLLVTGVILTAIAGSVLNIDVMAFANIAHLTSLGNM